MTEGTTPGHPIGISSFLDFLTGNLGLARSVISTLYSIATVSASLLLTQVDRRYRNCKLFNRLSDGSDTSRYLLIGVMGLLCICLGLSTQVSSLTQTITYGVLMGSLRISPDASVD